MEQPPLRINFSRTERLTDEEFYIFCRDNNNLRIERQADGTITIMSPESILSSHVGTLTLFFLVGWNMKGQSGQVFGSSAGFTLNDSAVLSADVSWVSKDRLAQIPKAEWNKFARVCPEFVVEVLSPSDSVKVTEKKMHQWIANGAEVGWMINPVKETIKIFRPGQDATTVKGFDQQLIAGDPMPGFVLDLQLLRSLIA